MKNVYMYECMMYHWLRQMYRCIMRGAQCMNVSSVSRMYKWNGCIMYQCMKGDDCKDEERGKREKMTNR